MAVTGGTAMPVPPTGGTVTTRPGIAIARRIALLGDLHTVHLTAGPPTAPAIARRGATVTPRTLTAATPPPRGTTVPLTELAETRRHQRK